MIAIKQNFTNTNVVFTLNELATISPFDVLFEFTNDTTGQVKLFTASDVSPAPDRYNNYTITENTMEDLYNGIVRLDPIGYWSYVVYEMPVASPPSLDPTNAIKVLENGKVLVIPDSVVVDPTFDDNDEINNVVFQ